MLEVISTIFELFRSQGRPLVFIRPKSLTEPEIYIGDFDLLILPKDTDAFFSVVHQVCADFLCSFILKRNRLDKMELRLFSNDGNKSVLMDVWTELDIKTPAISNGSAILMQTLIDKNYILIDSHYQAAFAPNFAALYYLSHLYSKQKSLESPEVQTRLIYYRKLPELESNIIKWIENPTLETMQLANKELQRLEVVEYTLQRHLLKIGFRLKQDIRKKRTFISIVGPDGVGKTTVIDSLVELTNGKYFRFKKVFRKSLAYKLLQKLTKNKLNKQFGYKLAKNQYDDLQQKKLFWIGLFGGYLRGLTLNIGQFKLIDRYYPDLLISGTRFSNQSIIRDHNAFKKIKLCPTPLAYVQLDAPAEVILKRKQELSANAINQLRNEYFELGYALTSPLFVYINNSHSVEATKKILKQIKL